MRNHFHIKDFTFFVRQRSSDISIIREVIEKDTYFARYNTPFFMNIRGGETVVDIGAHIGSFSVYAGSKGAAVLAYEPYSVSYKLLCENAKLNGYDITPIKKGVAGKREERTLYIRDFNFGGNNIYHENNNPDFQEKIEVITLEDVFTENNLQRIDFLKLDCEGAELDIMSNAVELLPKIDRIAFEYHGMVRKNEMVALLDEYHLYDHGNYKFGTMLAKRKDTS